MFTDFLIVLTVLVASFLFMILTALMRACLRYIRSKIFKPQANRAGETAAVPVETAPIPASPPPSYDDVMSVVCHSADIKRVPLVRADFQLPTYEQLDYLSLNCSR